MSSAVARLVHARRRQARVVAVMRSAVYLATDDPVVPALAVITTDAVRVPNAVLISARAVDSPFAEIRPSSSAVVGAGEIAVGALRVVAGASWAPPRPRLADPASALERAGELRRLVYETALPAPDMVLAPLHRLEQGLCTRDTEVVQRSAHQLVGLGPGLTPSGDDVLCGVLVTCRALAGADTGLARIDRGLTTVAELAGARTSFVSAALLRHAARGEVMPQLARLLATLGTNASLVRPLRDVLAVGHHSGSDLARGVAVTLAAAALEAHCAVDSGVGS